MGFSSNGMTSIRNNRSMQKSKKNYFRSQGRTSVPTGFYNKNDNTVLKDRMQMREARIFLVFGILCVGLGLLLTMWFL